MKLVVPVESIVQNKGGVILYDVEKNKILEQYIHDKEWKRCGWRGGKLIKNTLIATDWNELHFFDIDKWEYKKVFRKSTFNDLHYVEVFDGLLYIVNTGLDAIEIFENPMNPKFKEIIFLFDKNPKLFEKRVLDLNRKYNKEMKVKPHVAHPNCVAYNGKEVYVTCFGKKQKMNTGEVVELTTGKKIFKNNFDCHDGLFHNGKFYTTWTRHAKILEFKNLKDAVPLRRINIGPRGWWRGMVMNENNAYVFASDGYKGRKTTVRLATVNLTRNQRKIQKLPVVDGVYWDTVYQPNIYEV